MIRTMTRPMTRTTDAPEFGLSSAWRYAFGAFAYGLGLMLAAPFFAVLMAPFYIGI